MDISGIDYVSFHGVIQRGTAEIIEENDHAVLIYDSMSGIHMVPCDDAEAGKALIDRHADLDYRLVETTSKEVAEYVHDRYGMDDEIEECWQFAYLGEPPEPDPRITVRTAVQDDLPVIMEVYDGVSEDEMRRDISLGAVMMAYDGDDLVGFMGEHLEGSLGMLYIYPEFRRKGYAAALENIGFAKVIKDGRTPFGQVITDNVASYNLQKKKGLTQADKLVYWTWKE